MTLSNRIYTPEVGKLVKMRTFENYTSRGIHPWAWLKVFDVTPALVSFRIMNGPNETDHFSTCLLSDIQPPLGWESTYTIYAKPEQAETIVNDWFARGIAVRQSHDMGGSMPTAFQPMDNSASPHWQFTEVTDAIPAADCRKVFRVVSVIEEEITGKLLGLFDPSCTFCKGSGRDSAKRIAKVREVSEESIKESIREGLTEDEETKRLSTNCHVTNYDDADGTFECTCHYGAIKALGRTKRGKLFAAMRSEGWLVTFVRYAGGFWIRRRETVIHEPEKS
jgi:hypothetical protein